MWYGGIGHHWNHQAEMGGNSLKHHPKLHLHVGLRTFKTALAVTIALLIAQLINSYSPIFAGLGAIVAMTRTLRDALEAAKTQFVGVILGGIIGLILLLISPTPEALLTGAGVLAVLCLCALFKLYYAMSLAAIIVLSVCVSTSGNPILGLAYRLVDTAIGLGVGLAINMLIKPYNNRPRVIQLFWKLANSLPAYLDDCVIKDLYPDLTGYETGLRTLAAELDIYRRQHFRKREAHEQDVIFLQGLYQLAERIHQELCALCCMDFIGKPLPRNLERLKEVGIEIPSELPCKCGEEEVTVTNYHLDRILDARDFLIALLES